MIKHVMNSFEWRSVERIFESAGEFWMMSRGSV